VKDCLDVRSPDDAAVLAAEEIFEENPNREGEP
jgi:hypothetical protein